MLQTTSSMSSRLNCSTIEATVCLCSFICPVRSGDRGLVLLALRNAPSERFCLIGLSIYISDFLLLFVLHVYLSIDIVYHGGRVVRHRQLMTAASFCRAYWYESGCRQ